MTVPILNTEWGVHIAWGDVPTLNALLDRWEYEGLTLEEDHWDGHRAGCVFSARKEPVIIFPDKPSLDPVLIGCVAHEAFHAVNHIMRTIQVEEIDEEIMAHSIGAIVREYMNMARGIERT